ncbi:hypothetical protein [Priestia endophytica]|uniref:hypothetical protein n=1 Tax=Priestia endophytica TaxID=135735 RepID=UPI000DCA6243|nr:hypothetical protein [Priestia endophytica]RAS83086.1 hypothetical protein A4R27_08045 [Priestia endophytica]
MNQKFIEYSVLAMKYHNDEISIEKIENMYKEKIDSNITKIPKIWLATIKDFLFEDEKLFWEKEISEAVYTKICELNNAASNDNIFFERFYSSLEHFFIALSGYDDIINTLNLFKEYSIPNELELRMHYLPTYNSIVEGCLANLFKFLRDNLDLADSKNLLEQTKLDGLVNIMRTRGLEILITDIDIDIRNAINHGGIYVHDEKGVTFFYNKRQKGTLSKELSTYDLERKITKLIDCASSIFVGILRFFIDKGITLDRLKRYSNQENILVYQSLVRLELSTFHKKCLFLTNDFNINTQNQITASFHTEELSVGEKLEFALLTFFRLYHYFPNHQRFFLRFSSERALPSVIGVNISDIEDFVNGKIANPEDLASLIVHKETPILWEPSVEEIDIKEAKTAYYSNIKNNDYEITDIKDVSTENQKRFRANLFIGEVTRKNHVKKAVRDAINEIKLLKNYPKLQHRIKHGDISADAIYINIFKQKARKGRREKHLISNNENFIATVQYNNNLKNKQTHEIERNGVWKDFIFRQEGDIEYGWNPNFLKIK